MTENYLQNKSLIISFPRSGTHWINAMLEYYLQQYRYPREDEGLHFINENLPLYYYGSAVHDKTLDILPSKSEYGDILLVRDPVDAIFSLKSVDSISTPETRDSVENLAVHWKKLHTKWIPLVKNIIFYEKAVKNPLNVLKVLSKHFDKPWDVEQAKKTLKVCGDKKTIMTKVARSVFHNENVLKETYKINRENFRNKYQKKIYEIVLTENTKHLLREIKKC